MLFVAGAAKPWISLSAAVEGREKERKDGQARGGRRSTAKEGHGWVR